MLTDNKKFHRRKRIIYFVAVAVVEVKGLGRGAPLRYRLAEGSLGLEEYGARQRGATSSRCGLAERPVTTDSTARPSLATAAPPADPARMKKAETARKLV
ncbi:hypothetical protein AAFF_G00400790 [Aldrovandia affinis]|uniref:Uncharacterized protein n=1 Tax=Aldrovandia affinis TaxID=143900 RepID=A0AAD7SCF4_9TELE|nr:hypothetical protein AAFF_G00400790 [Aldrovandia affinis]